MRWITRARPKIDRIACPWLIKRFVDAEAEFFFVPPDQVKPRAIKLAQGMVLYDALYSWARHVRNERHSWNPQRGPAPALA